jgi:hypothetical protein
MNDVDETPSIGLSEEDKSTIKEISNVVESLLNATLPDIFYKLIKDGKMDMSKADDLIYLMTLAKNNFPAESEFKLYCSIHNEFIDCAKMALDQNKKIVALSLICTVIEHHLNFYYRKALEMRDISDDDIKEILRMSNFNTKLTWLQHLVFQCEIPPEEKTYMTKIIELRNKIIHFKAKPGKTWNDGSAAEISNEIKKLDFSILFQYPEKLQLGLELMLDEEYPDYKKAKELAQSILDKVDTEQMQKYFEKDFLSRQETDRK